MAEANARGLGRASVLCPRAARAAAAIELECGGSTPLWTARLDAPPAVGRLGGAASTMGGGPRVGDPRYGGQAVKPARRKRRRAAALHGGGGKPQD